MKRSIVMSAITSTTPITMIAILNADAFLFGGVGVCTCTTGEGAGGGDSHNSRGCPHRSSLPEFSKNNLLENK